VKTELNDRTLWFDGTSQVNPALVPSLFLGGIPPELIALNEESEDTRQFNQFSEEQLTVGKDKNRPLNMAWKVPKSYQDIDLANYVLDAVGTMALAQRWDYETTAKYAQRVKVELEEIQIRGMDPLVKTLIYVIDTLKETKTVWGVGRGSSCASLVLFIIGLHKVDPIKYGIAMEEFFHD